MAWFNHQLPSLKLTFSPLKMGAPWKFGDSYWKPVIFRWELLVLGRVVTSYTHRLPPHIAFHHHPDPIVHGTSQHRWRSLRRSIISMSRLGVSFIIRNKMMAPKKPFNKGELGPVQMFESQHLVNNSIFSECLSIFSSCSTDLKKVFTNL